MKKAIIASLVALTSGVAITAFALRGPDKLVDLRVNAEPQEYSVTFDAKSSIEYPPGSDDYAICTTTARGNKVGVVGSRTYIPQLDHLHFRDETNFFGALELGDFSCRLLNVGARDFGNITGFQVTFTGKLKLRYEVVNEEEEMFEEVEQDVESGVKYDVSLTPDDHPAFERDEHSEEDVTIDSLTIWYSC